MPTWPPAAAPVGPWRPVEVVVPTGLGTTTCTTTYDGIDGAVTYAGIWSGGAAPTSARLRVGRTTSELVIARIAADEWTLTGAAAVAEATPWFPSTHGDPHLYEVTIEIELEGGATAHFDQPAGPASDRSRSTRPTAHSG